MRNRRRKNDEQKVCNRRGTLPEVKRENDRGNTPKRKLQSYLSVYTNALSSLSISDSYIVRVKAVVMTRDDSSGGWLAQDGGALSRVGVCRLLPPELAPMPASSFSQFLIRGERLRDKQVILDCPLRKDLVYTIATPTFHHWKVEDRKCGLSFQSPADARAFDRGVRKAIEDLAEGSTTSSTALQNEGELGDDDVFTNTTDSSSNSSQKLESSLQPLESSPLPQRHKCVLGHRHDLHDPYRLSDHYFLDQPLSQLPRHVTFQEDEEIVRINPRERSWERTTERHHGRPSDRPWLTGYEDYRHATVRDKFIQMDTESYVHFAKTEAQKHDYTYPLAPALSPSDSDPALGPLRGTTRTPAPATGARAAGEAGWAHTALVSPDRPVSGGALPLPLPAAPRFHATRAGLRCGCCGGRHKAMS
ncbi:hypothetical protein L3Q82_012037 [Scortum barcoo]|uniref:Uncharacterized protein n=1 Tax=Scortum barcoo TaxID=214431 RepID=A0ACB8W5Y4_9TELE|nr:hypothetical protein L3Q82_012037 [Scortum barcoo]